MDEPIFVTRAMLPPIEEYMQTIAPLWDSHMLTNHGQLHGQLEEKLKQYLEVPYLTLYANGHLALESVLQSLELRGEVITTPFTFQSTTNAIIRCGLTPVFCDILEEEYTMDPGKIEALITENTCAILPVHVYGRLCHMDEIEAVAQKYGLPVIYDAAHIFGTAAGSENPLLRGKASILSFHATKIFNTVEGGAVVTADKELYKKVYFNGNYGFEGPEITHCVGGNAKMSEFHAAMGICNLKYVERELQQRKHLANLYRELLEKNEELEIPAEPENYRLNNSYFPLVFRGGKQVRDRVYQILAEQGYFGRKYFYPLTCEQTCIRDHYPTAHLTVARRISDSILCLPIFGELQQDHVRKICGIISDVIQKGLEENGCF